MTRIQFCKQKFLKFRIYDKLVRSSYITQNYQECGTGPHGTTDNTADNCVEEVNYVQIVDKLKTVSSNFFLKEKYASSLRYCTRNVSNDVFKRTGFLKTTALLTEYKAVRNHVRFYCSNVEDECTTESAVEEELRDEDDEKETIMEAEHLLKDTAYNECIKQYCSLPDVGHRVFIVQLAMTGSKRKENKSPVHLQLAENEALVHSIPRWTVVDSATVKVKEQSSPRLMTKAFEKVKDQIRSNPNISAVFISRNMLSAEYHVLAQSMWKLPVFDRSFIVTQVFKAQAKTREAKLHLGLAELPFLRFCMTHGFQPGVYGRPEKKYMRFPFEEREKKLKAALATLNKQRVMSRNRRSVRQIPTIAVIGYTNCGKTTLIKALTGDENLIPRNKLFATLDVTAHGGLLPNKMMIIYMDTVGFLTDLPPFLQGAFTATLEDTLHSDLIIHVQDASHPDLVAQGQNVRQSIQKLVPKHKLDSMIEVYNKLDRIEESERESILGSVPDQDVFCISSVTGEGMEDLRQEVQKRLLKNINFLQKKIKIPLQGPHLGWLYKEATVVSTETDDDPESLIVNIYISQGKYQKFMANFGSRQTTRIQR